MLHAKEKIRSGNIDDALGQLNDLLVDENEALGEAALARINTLKALGHFVQADDEEAIAAFERVVGSACAVVCSDQAFVGTGVANRQRSPRPAVFRFRHAHGRGSL